MAKKDIKKVIPTRGAKSSKTEVKTQAGQPTEEEKFGQYVNNILTTTVLDMENAKQRTLENMKSLTQQLATYVRLVAKLEEENKNLKEQLKKK